MDDIHDMIMNDLGLNPPERTPEQEFFSYLTNDKYSKLHNCQYWLKHELHVYSALHEKGWHISKPGKLGEPRQQVPFKDIARELMRYYLQMVYLTKFEGERHAERGKLVDMEKFLDMIMEYHTIKKLVENPNTLI